MNKKLIIVDLDGTTLENFTTIHPKSKEVLMKAKKAGHIVAIATGRPFRATSHFYDELELDTLLANYNGGYIHHPMDQEIEDTLAPVDMHLVLDILTKVESLIINAFAEYRDDIYLHEESKDQDLLDALHIPNGLLYTGDIRTTLKSDPISLVLVIKPEFEKEVLEILSTYNDRLVHRQWEGKYSTYIELYDINTHKAVAVEHMSKYYNIPLEDVIAIGDGTNDLEMISKAGVGVAMKNAHPELKKRAKIVLEYTNEEGGVGLFLEEYLNLK